MGTLLLAGGVLAFLAIVALAVWPRRPPPVIGQLLPFHDPKKRKRFESWLH